MKDVWHSAEPNSTPTSRRTGICLQHATSWMIEFSDSDSDTASRTEYPPPQADPVSQSRALLPEVSHRPRDRYHPNLIQVQCPPFDSCTMSDSLQGPSRNLSSYRDCSSHPFISSFRASEKHCKMDRYIQDLQPRLPPRDISVRSESCVCNLFCSIRSHCAIHWQGPESPLCFYLAQVRRFPRIC
ncbi:hypothetical protein B0H19DRAFT_128705 [Mycena capillaripes]|nr:hypothetical protein B0H19DRAFT_128705 [Mycena capillaripes]